MVRILNTFLDLFVCSGLIADLPPITREDFEKDYYSLQSEKNAQIFKIKGSRNGVSLKDKERYGLVKFVCAAPDCENFLLNLKY